MPPELAGTVSGSKTVLTPLKWDVCITPESRHRSASLPIAMSIVCYAGAEAGHLSRLLEQFFHFLLREMLCQPRHKTLGRYKYLLCLFYRIFSIDVHGWISPCLFHSQQIST
jgi:hypothetical protein